MRSTAKDKFWSMLCQCYINNKNIKRAIQLAFQVKPCASATHCRALRFNEPFLLTEIPKSIPKGGQNTSIFTLMHLKKARICYTNWEIPTCASWFSCSKTCNEWTEHHLGLSILFKVQGGYHWISLYLGEIFTKKLIIVTLLTVTSSTRFPIWDDYLQTTAKNRKRGRNEDDMIWTKASDRPVLQGEGVEPERDKSFRGTIRGGSQSDIIDWNLENWPCGSPGERLS